MGLLVRRRRPVRNAAMLAGAGAVAYHAGKKRGASQEPQSGYEDQPQDAAPPAEAAPAPVPAAAPAPDLAGQLTQLKQMLDQGALTEAEYETAKQRVLAGG